MFLKIEHHLFKIDLLHVFEKLFFCKLKFRNVKKDIIAFAEKTCIN